MIEMVTVNCVACGAELTVPKAIESKKAVCNGSCYWKYVHEVEHELYQVDFCEKSDWACLGGNKSE